MSVMRTPPSAKDSTATGPRQSPRLAARAALAAGLETDDIKSVPEPADASAQVSLAEDDDMDNPNETDKDNKVKVTHDDNEGQLKKDNENENYSDNGTDSSHESDSDPDSDAQMAQLRRTVQAILHGLDTKLANKDPYLLDTGLPSTIYPVHAERNNSKGKNVEDLNDNVVIKSFKTDITEAIVAGLVLAIATDDYKSLDKIPMTLRSGATALLLKMLPRFLPPGDISKAELEASGLNFDLLRRSTRNYPTYLVTRLIAALTQHLGILMVNIPDEAGSIEVMRGIVVDLQTMISSQQVFLENLLKVWRAFSRRHASNQKNPDAVENSLNEDYLAMLNELGKSFFPDEAARLINTIADFRSMLAEVKHKPSDVENLDTAIIRLGRRTAEPPSFEDDLNAPKDPWSIKSSKWANLENKKGTLPDTNNRGALRNATAFRNDLFNVTAAAIHEEPRERSFEALDMTRRPDPSFSLSNLGLMDARAQSTRIAGNPTNLLSMTSNDLYRTHGAGDGGDHGGGNGGSRKRGNDDNGSGGRKDGYGAHRGHGGGSEGTGGRGGTGGGGNTGGGGDPPSDPEPSDSSSSPSSTNSDDDEETKQKKRKLRKRHHKRQAKKAAKRMRELERRIRRNERENRGKDASGSKRNKDKDSCDSDSSNGGRHDGRNRVNKTTSESLLKAYSGNPPVGGFGAGALPEEEAIKSGYYGNELNLEIHRSWQKTHEDAGPGILTARANQSIKLMNAATQLAQQDVSSESPEAQLKHLQSRLDVMTQALSPDSIRMLATGGAIDNRELGLGLQSSYIRVPAPTLGTKPYDTRDKKKVESIIGDKWGGKSIEQGDTCDAIEFFTAIASTIEGRLNAHGAMTLLRVSCKGAVRQTLKNIPDGRAFGHVWHTLTSLHHSTTDFLEIRRKKLRLMEVKPTNIAYCVNKVLGYNKLENLRFSKSEREAILISQTRADLLYIVTTHFPEQHDDIVLPDRRHGQRWSDERESARRNGRIPDLLSYDYDPILSLANLIVERLEMIYGQAVKQPISARDPEKKPDMPRRGFKVGSVDLAAIGEALLSAASGKTRKADSEHSTEDAEEAPRFEEVNPSENPEDEVNALGASSNNFAGKRDRVITNKGAPLKASGDDLPTLSCGLCGGGYHKYVDCKIYPEGRAVLGKIRKSCCGGHHTVEPCRRPFRLGTDRVLK